MNRIFATLPKVSEINIIMSVIIFATLTRMAIPSFIGHPPNFSAIDATALFCGAYLGRPILASIVVLFSVWIGDLFINHMLMGHWVLFYEGFYWQYMSYVLIAFIGILLRNHRKSIYLIPASLASSLLFFVISNFGVWYSGLMYPLTFEGLISCYVAAIPFFKNTLISDVFFAISLFGIFEMVKVKLRSNLQTRYL